MDVSSASKSTKQSDNETPGEIFAKVLTNDRIQNKNLTGKLSKSHDVEKAMSRSDSASRARFIVCTLGLISLAMSQMSRTVMNVTIVSMVDPNMMQQQTSSSVSTDGSCPWPDEEQESATTEMCLPDMSEVTTRNGEPEVATTTQLSVDTQTVQSTTTEFTTAESTTITTESWSTTDSSTEQSTTQQSGMQETTTISALTNHEQQMPESNVTIDDHIDKDQPPKFKWTIKQQNVLLGSFFYSYFFFMILGGRISEIYGAKYVLMLGVFGSSVISIAVPWIASHSFYLLVFSRMLMGCLQAGVFPAMYALISKWLTMSEASIYAPLIKMNLRLGMLLGSLVPGLIADWRNVYYLTGFLGFIWSVLWFFIASSDPQDNRWVNELELKRILRKKKKKPTLNSNEQLSGIELTDSNSPSKVAENKKQAKSNISTPWIGILTNSSVIGLIIVKITFNCGVDFVSIEVPSYLRYVHHATREQISAITTGMFSMQVALVVFVGWLAKIMVQKKPFGLSKTGTRIFFQSLSSGGAGLCMFLLTFNDCSLIYTATFLLLISFTQMFTAGGETMLPYDLTEEYPATIMAIANSVGNTSGICVTILASYILGNQGGSYERWNILIYLISGLLTFGAIMFALLIKAETVDFGTTKMKEKEKSETEQSGEQTQPAAVVSPAKESACKLQSDVAIETPNK